MKFLPYIPSSYVAVKSKWYSLKVSLSIEWYYKLKQAISMNVCHGTSYRYKKASSTDLAEIGW